MIKLAIYGVESIDTFRYNGFLLNEVFLDGCSDTLHLYVEDNMNQSAIKSFEQYFDYVVVKKILFCTTRSVKNLLLKDEINFLILNSYTAGDL